MRATGTCGACGSCVAPRAVAEKAIRSDVSEGVAIDTAGGRYARRCEAMVVRLATLADFLLDAAPDLVLIFEESRVALDTQLARPRQIDLDARLHPPWSPCKDHYPVGQVHGLFDVVGDEQRRLARLTPD